MKTTRFTRRLPKPGTRSNGVLGDINLAFRCGWYITPWGYLLVRKAGCQVFEAQAISYSADLIVGRYNNRMGSEQNISEYPLSWNLNKHKGLATGRGWK